MSITPEKNDVDISKLFTWGKQYSILDRTGEKIIDYYARLVGDADINRARVYALRKSAEMRRVLKNKDNDDRKAYIMDEDLVDGQKLIEIILIMSMKDVIMKSINEIDIPFPKEPDSDATLEEQEKYQEEIDNWPKIREQKVEEFVNTKTAEMRKGLEIQTKEYLYRKYEELVIVDFCEKVMTSSYSDACAFYGSYRDSDYKEKLFKDIDEFLNLPSEIKEQFVDNYTSLEISMESLKK